jgi:Protein of unknown function (DUF2510)
MPSVVRLEARIEKYERLSSGASHWPKIYVLFFVPVIPISRKYHSVCIQCGLTLEVPKSAAEEMASPISTGAGLTPDPVSPPLPSAASAPDSPMPPAGWYPDPSGSHALRYWDGHAWTEVVKQP